MRFPFKSLWEKIVVLAFMMLLTAPLVAVVPPDQTTLSDHPMGIIEIGVFIALIAQIGGFFYFAGKIKAAIEGHDKRLTNLEERGSVNAIQAGVVAANTADEVKELRERLESHIEDYDRHLGHTN